MTIAYDCPIHDLKQYMGHCDLVDDFKIERQIVGKDFAHAATTTECQYPEFSDCVPGVILKIWNLMFEVFLNESFVHMM